MVCVLQKKSSNAPSALRFTLFGRCDCVTLRHRIASQHLSCKQFVVVSAKPSLFGVMMLSRWEQEWQELSSASLGSKTFLTFWYFQENGEDRETGLQDLFSDRTLFLVLLLPQWFGIADVLLVLWTSWHTEITGHIPENPVCHSAFAQWRTLISSLVSCSVLSTGESWTGVFFW